MGRVIWQREQKKALNPYYAELAGVLIYDLEELNYFFQKYFYLIDQNTYNDALVLFLQDEMERPDLAKLIYMNRGKIHPVAIASKVINGISESKVDNPQEWRKKAADYQRLSDGQQKLFQADIFYRLFRYDQAEVLYESLIDGVKDSRVRLDNEEIATVCYRLSRIALESMSWKAAGAYLYEAFMLSQDQEILKELYFLTCMSPEVICDSHVFADVNHRTIRNWNQEYARKKEAIEANRSLSGYEAMINNTFDEEERQADTLLTEWKRDFRKIRKNSCQEAESSV